MRIEKDVIEYFSKYFLDDPDILQKYDSKTLTFSYILGMHPSECMYMEVEEDDWSSSQIREYDEIESIISKLKRSK